MVGAGAGAENISFLLRNTGFNVQSQGESSVKVQNFQGRAPRAKLQH